MLNPVIQQLLAADLRGRYNNGQQFMLALMPDATVPMFVTPDMRPWINATMQMPQRSTSREEYERHLIDVIGQHRDAGGGKTVISRVSVTGAPELSSEWWNSTIQNLFSNNGNSLRYIANTPYGLWIGATPELLLHFDKSSRDYSTMALAGTRTRTASATGAPWDDKNIYENSLVGRYITSRLSAIGLIPHISEPDTLTYGAIEHLVQHITGNAGDIKAETIVSALNPTPALAGYPMERALETIAAHESHDRMYYGGIIVIDSAGCYDVYVNLRCCVIADGRAVMFGGGGITADSNINDEWTESGNKMAAIKSIASL